jgi:plastocyanin
MAGVSGEIMRMRSSCVRLRIGTAGVALGVVLLAGLLAGAGIQPGGSQTRGDDKMHPDDRVHKVTIKNLKYDPLSLKIEPGETVLWTNEDDSDHTVISDDPHNKDFRSDNLGHGDAFRYTFKKAGKFPYHCKYHPRMKGIVVVAR